MRTVPVRLLIRPVVESEFLQVFAIRESCPYCGNWYASHLLGISSGLGSTMYSCKSCGRRFLSGRREWSDMSAAGKVWYYLISIAYIISIAIPGGAAGAIIVAVFAGGMTAAERKHLPVAGPAVCGAIATACGIAILQYLRTKWSLQRTESIPRQELVASFLSFHTNLQQLAGLAVLLVMAVLCSANWLVEIM